MDPDTDCSAVIKTTSYSNSSLDDGAAMMYFQRRERKVEDGGKGGEREGVGRGGRRTHMLGNKMHLLRCHRPTIFFVCERVGGTTNALTAAWHSG